MKWKQFVIFKSKTCLYNCFYVYCRIIYCSWGPSRSGGWVGACQSILPDPCKAVSWSSIQNVRNFVCKVSSHINWQGITKSFDFLIITVLVCKVWYLANRTLCRGIGHQSTVCFAVFRRQLLSRIIYSSWGPLHSLRRLILTPCCSTAAQMTMLPLNHVKTREVGKLVVLDI